MFYIFFESIFHNTQYSKAFHKSSEKENNGKKDDRFYSTVFLAMPVKFSVTVL